MVGELTCQPCHEHFYGVLNVEEDGLQTPLAYKDGSHGVYHLIDADVAYALRRPRVSRYSPLVSWDARVLGGHLSVEAYGQKVLKTEVVPVSALGDPQDAEMEDVSAGMDEQDDSMGVDYGMAQDNQDDVAHPAAPLEAVVQMPLPPSTAIEYISR